jgi:uncharacterized membrane protein YccC
VTSATGTVGRIVRESVKLDRSGVELGFAVRCTTGVAIPLGLALLAGQPLAGVSAAFGAMSAGFASRQGVYRTRALGMLVTTLGMAVSGFIGCHTGTEPVANVIRPCCGDCCWGCSPRWAPPRPWSGSTPP